MKGWVYVISNQAMPGLVKIGYSTKDPKLRAEELNHTGSPHPYLVDYEVLIDEPFSLEQQVHNVLGAVREGKEWFRCSAEEAAAAIQHEAGGRAIHESYKRAERQKTEQIRRQQEVEEARLKAEYEVEQLRRKKEEEIEARCRAREQEIRVKYELKSSAGNETSIMDELPYGWYVLFAIIAALVLDASSIGGLLFSAVLGTVAGVLFKKYRAEKEKTSPESLALLKKRDIEIEQLQQRCDVEKRELHKPSVPLAPSVERYCPKCSKFFRGTKCTCGYVI